ncbi:hypothetical protein PQX77_019990 [Marasmius sp. AFHP31]|nr:hypothetical protein PQX77_019990 [Marasmius sp. AFHP31]
MSAVDFYSLDAMGPPATLADGLLEVIPQMPLLHTFKITNSSFFGAWTTLLRVVLAMPNIHTLEIRDSVWRTPAEAFTETDLRTMVKPLTPRIRTFIYHAPFTDCFPLGSKSYGRRDHFQGALEVSNLLVLIETFRFTLEVLDIPAELAPRLISEIATSHTSPDTLFPNLREMRVQGHTPFSGSSRDSSSAFECWQGFFTPSGWAPKLHDLSLQMAALPGENNRTLGMNYSIFPLFHDLGFQDLEHQGTLTQLHSFALSTPVVHDLLYQILPKSLAELDLRAYPLPGVVGGSTKCVRTVVPSASQLSTILEVVNLPRLETLKLSYRIEDDVDRLCEETLMAGLAKTLWTISSLEIHRYRPHARSNSDDDPIHPLTRHLSSMAYLKTISLNLDFPERPRHHQAIWNGPNVASQRQANQKALEMGTVKTLAECMKCLSSIRILSHEDFSSHWNSWDVLRRQGSQPKVQIVELISRGRSEV